MPQLNMLDVATCVAAIVSALGAIAAVVVALYISRQAILPQIVAYLEFDADHSCMYLVVKNIGNGVARDIRIDGFDCSLAGKELREYRSDKSFVARGIPCLVPNAWRQTIILKAGDMRVPR